MSLRRRPQTLDEQFAYFEERFRQLDAGARVEPTDVRYLYDFKGDVLFAAGRHDPQPLHIPFAAPVGPGRYVLAAAPSRDLGAEWVFVDNLAGISGSSSGSGGGGGGVTAHGALTGLSGNDHPQYTTDAEATALAATEVTAHEGEADPHTVYLLESAYVAGHVVEDEGTPLTQRANMNFTGAGVAVTDAGGKTVVTIGGGGGSAAEPSVSDWML